jgi:hypothetical protein
VYKGWEGVHDIDADKNRVIQSRNRAKLRQEYIGMTRVTYSYSPNGKVQISVACSKYPFKLENDEDIEILFSFFGQVRDRMLFHLKDPHEHKVPLATRWRLVGCDINKDIRIDENMQFTLPDIQLKHADRVSVYMLSRRKTRHFVELRNLLQPRVLLLRHKVISGILTKC